MIATGENQNFLSLRRCGPTWNMASSLMRLHDSSRRGISSSQRHLPYNTHTGRHPCPPEGFEARTSRGDCPQTYAVDRADTGAVKKNQNA